jgi:LAO/AO transport system kinase
LHPKIIEITELMKCAGFDHVIIETVGVGQSEIEIAGLADVTVVVVVPEAGDEVQTMKAGLMEIADIFVVNKSDRPDADQFVKNLRLMLAPAYKEHREIPVIKAIASEKKGVHELYEAIEATATHSTQQERKLWLLTERAWHLLQLKKMKPYSKQEIKKEIEQSAGEGRFNLYQFIADK